MKILLVEDHKETANRLGALLQKAEGVSEVVICGTLADGLAKSNDLKADITILDLMLPDVKSWRETVAAIPKFHPPVIVVSELSDPEISEQCFLAGAADYLNKRTALGLIALLISAITSARMRRVASEINGMPAS